MPPNPTDPAANPINATIKETASHGATAFNLVIPSSEL
jgi:hypothetical protein